MWAGLYWDFQEVRFFISIFSGENAYAELLKKMENPKGILNVASTSAIVFQSDYFQSVKNVRGDSAKKQLNIVMIVLIVNVGERIIMTLIHFREVNVCCSDLCHDYYLLLAAR